MSFWAVEVLNVADNPLSICSTCHVTNRYILFFAVYQYSRLENFSINHPRCDPRRCFVTVTIPFLTSTQTKRRFVRDGLVCVGVPFLFAILRK